MKLEPLPLFPLQVVLFPEEPFPLHIFEERYKLMVGECLESDTPFGVILAERNGIRQVGCTARIVQVIEKFPDGRMNILTRGERRFRVLRTYSLRPYLQGEVEYFEDAPGTSSSELARQVLALVGDSARLPLNLPPEIEEDPVRLSFVLGSALKIPLREKQKILETDSTEERLNLLIEHLEQKKDRDTKISRDQKIASRNGHP